MALQAQAPPAKVPAKTPDVLVFVNGEQLSGVLESASSDGIVFKSPMAGEIKVKWSNIKQLRSDKNFALLSKQEKLTRHDALAVVPQGTISLQDKEIVVTTATGPRTVPIAQTDRILDAAAFDKAIAHPPGLLEGWSGTSTVGASLVRSTQRSTSFTGTINLTREDPIVDWLPNRDRTLIDYTQSYGSTSQPGASTLLTNIFHASAEQDEYFSPRAYAFGSATFDHDFSQSLNLQQAYGVGVGITLIKNAARQLDFKGDAHYEKQGFIDPAQNLDIFGSTFSETYLRHLPKGFVINEFGSISPSWNQLQAYSAHIKADLVFPVYKGLGFNLGAVDDYLNNAPAGSNKNSTQFTSGLSYTFKAH